jgi:hypothetical protein
MLRMRVRLADTHDPWSWDGKRWSAGVSVVEPFTNPALCCHVPAPRKLVVRETRSGGDSLAVDIQPGRVSLSAGTLGAAPLYLTGNGKSLYGSWNVADLARFASPDRIVDRVVARLLTRRHRYSSETLFRNITRLTERARAEFSSDDLRISYPPDAQHVLTSRRLTPDADLVEAFGNHLSIITESANQHTPLSGRTVHIIHELGRQRSSPCRHRQTPRRPREPTRLPRPTGRAVRGHEPVVTRPSGVDNPVMAEPTAPEIDRTLANLVAVIDALPSARSDGPGVTLTLSGLVVSGRVIPQWQWFDEVEHASRAAFTVHTGGSIDDEHGGWANLFKADHESAVTDRDEYLKVEATIRSLPERYRRRIAQRERPHFIHLSGTRVFAADAAHPLPAGGMHWRGRLSQVSGWSFGLITVDTD